MESRSPEREIRRNTLMDKIQFTDKRLGIYKTYLHKPPHLFVNNAYYITTAHTIKGTRPLKKDEYKEIVIESLHFGYEQLYDWELICYVVLDDHYHILVKADENAINLPKIIESIHKFTSREINKLENKQGRKIWHQYWDTVITNQRSFFARFNYIHYNPVKHGYVKKMSEYKYSSFNDYYRTDENKLKNIWMEYPFDRLKIEEP